jgi:hypothetical protein
MVRLVSLIGRTRRGDAMRNVKELVALGLVAAVSACAYPAPYGGYGYGNGYNGGYYSQPAYSYYRPAPTVSEYHYHHDYDHHDWDGDRWHHD